MTRIDAGTERLAKLFDEVAAETDSPEFAAYLRRQAAAGRAESQARVDQVRAELRDAGCLPDDDNKS